MTGRSPTCRPTTTSPSTTRASARRSPRASSQHLEAQGVAKDKGGVLQINGSPTDAAAGLIRDGIHEGARRQRLQDARRVRHARLGAAQGAGMGERARSPRFGADIVGIVAANDGTGGGAIAAFKAAGVDPVPPVTGNDATIAALQLIIAGDQYNTISKPSEIVGAAAAQVAVAVPDGETPEPKTTLYDTPSRALRPGGRHPREHQGRGLRQGHQHRRRDLHRPLRRRLRRARHPVGSCHRRPAASPPGGLSPSHASGGCAGMTELHHTSHAARRADPAASAASARTSARCRR